MAQTQSQEHSSWIPMPAIIRTIYSHFPLYHYPSIPLHAPSTFSSNGGGPVLWIHPPLDSASRLLSKDVECLKWQAYIALRGLKDVRLRWDVDPAGGVDGRLPTLWLPSPPPPSSSPQPYSSKTHQDLKMAETGSVLGARMIPTWADGLQDGPLGSAHVWNSELEGYIDSQARDESRAWVALLEGAVHAALLSYQPAPSLLAAWLYSKISPVKHLQAILNPPAPPLTGFTTLIPPQGVNVPVTQLRQRYQEAIASLSERLGTDRWFLGSIDPTPLDALIFAYLHIALHPECKGMELARGEVTHRVNLVAWERKVRSIVQGAFKPYSIEKEYI